MEEIKVFTKGYDIHDVVMPHRYLKNLTARPTKENRIVDMVDDYKKYVSRQAKSFSYGASRYKSILVDIDNRKITIKTNGERAITRSVSHVKMLANRLYNVGKDVITEVI